MCALACAAAAAKAASAATHSPTAWPRAVDDAGVRDLIEAAAAGAPPAALPGEGAAVSP